MSHVWWRGGGEGLCHAYLWSGEAYLAACSEGIRLPDGVGLEARGELCVACLLRLRGEGSALIVHPGPRSGQPC
ncbi:hypothetical protein LV78_004026 [Actinosynnema pretiosum]|nr:hypothetical protein [Actinosynnema pretiosum]